jgi:hypothetical protein
VFFHHTTHLELREHVYLKDLIRSQAIFESFPLIGIELVIKVALNQNEFIP